MLRNLVLLVTLAALLTSGPASAYHEREERSLYVGGTDFINFDEFNPRYVHESLWGYCSHTLPVGGACFVLRGGEFLVDVTVTTAGLAPAAAIVVFYSGGYDRLSEATVCGHSRDLVVPAGTHQVSVYVLDPAVAPIFCYPQVPVSGVAGEIVLRFH